MKFSMLFSLLLTLTFSSMSLAQFKENRKMTIWPQIIFVPAGDFANFNLTIQQSRDQVRKMLWQEFSSTLIPLAMMGQDAAALAEPLAQILLMFDGMHEAHKAEANKGIPQSLDAILKSEFDQLFARFGVPEALRRAEFSSNSALIAAIHFYQMNHLPLPQNTALDAFFDLDFFLYGTYTIAERGAVEMTLTIEKFTTGQTRSFSAKGPINQAIKDLAQMLFHFFQANEYKSWENPQTNLQWIASPANQPEALAATARLYCRNQKARLPYARELIAAAQGGEYLPGGIPAFGSRDIYAISDRQRTDEQYYYYVAYEQASNSPIWTDAGQGIVKAKFWCVKGDPSNEVRWIENIYRIYRLNDNQEVRTTIEYLLTKVEDYSSRYDYRLKYKSIDDALKVLRSHNIIITVPDELTLGRD